MKYLLITLISIYVLFFSCAFLDYDRITSMFPGWNSMLKNVTVIRNVSYLLSNLFLPIYLYVYFRKSAASTLLIVYFLMNTFLLFLPELVPKNYIVNGAVNSEMHVRYFLIYMYITLTSYCVNFIFYCYLLWVEVRPKRRLEHTYS